MPNVLRSFLNFKLKLLGYQHIISTCITQVGYSQMATIRHGVVQIIKKCLYLWQINSDLYETQNLTLWVPFYQAAHLKFSQPK